MDQKNNLVIILLVNLIVLVSFNCHFVNSSDPVADGHSDSLEDEVTVEVDDSDPDVRINNILRNKHPTVVDNEDSSYPYYSFNFAEHLKKYNVDTSKLDDKEVTALAQVFEYPVENYLHRDNNTLNDSTSHPTPPKLIKVNCLTSYLPSIEELQQAEAEMLALMLRSKSEVDETPLNETVSGKSKSDGDGENLVEKSNSTEDENEVSNGDVDDLNSTLTISRTPRVELVNTSTLLNTVLYINPAVKNRSTASNCTLVFFYTDWCPFSANAAPHFNALPRAFPSIRMVGLNLNQGGYSQNYFGVLSIPTIVLFHNGKMISKFNDSSFTIHKFIRFVYRYTDLVVSELRINVTSEDFKGPISSVPTKLTDYNLIIAWIFLIFCFIHFISKSAYWISFIELVKSIWRDAEEHEHLE